MCYRCLGLKVKILSFTTLCLTYGVVKMASKMVEKDCKIDKLQADIKEIKADLVDICGKMEGI